MAAESIQIKFQSVGLKELQAELRETIKLLKQVSKEQKKAKIKINIT